MRKWKRKQKRKVEVNEKMDDEAKSKWTETAVFAV